MSEILAGALISEEQRLFSGKRALRGTTVGAKFGLGVVGVVVFGGIVDNGKAIELMVNKEIGSDIHRGVRFIRGR